MKPMRRILGPLLAFFLGATLLMGCTAPGSETLFGDSEPATPQTYRPEAAELPIGVVNISGDGWQGAIATSEHVYGSAPVVFVASAADEETVAIAGEQASKHGVPLLVSPQEPGENEQPVAELINELERLDARVVVTVGAVAGLEGKHTWRMARVDPQADPETWKIPDVEPVEKSSAVAIALENSDNAAALATLAAAGIEVLEVETPELTSTADFVDFFAGRSAPTVITLGDDFAGQEHLEWLIRAASTGYQLPGGGQEIFDDRQYVALYGTPRAPELGVLGHQGLDGAVARIKELSGEYQELSDHTVVSSFEIITTVASAFPGKDNMYSVRIPIEDIRPWIDRAGEEGMLVILDLQPGRLDFLTQAKEYQELLELPHVGLALDPEWRLKPNQVHLVQIGTVTAAEINEVTTWLADLVNEKGLPQKMVVLHQFQLRMISEREDIDLSRPELALLIHADGQGSQPNKQETWRVLHHDAPEGIRWGWKNFLVMDEPVLTPKQTMKVLPLPELITYQ